MSRSLKNETVGGFYENLTNSYGADFIKLNEALEAQGMSLLENASEVLKDDKMYSEITETLTAEYNSASVDGGGDTLSESIKKDNTTKFNQLMENTRQEILQESMTGNLKPVVGFSLPLLKTHWISNEMKNVVRTEVPTKYVFTKSLEQRYVMDNDGKKHFYKDMIENMATIKESIKEPVDDSWKTLPVETNLVEDSGGTKGTDQLSINTFIKAAKVEVPDGAGGTQENVVENLMIRPEADMGTAYGEVNTKDGNDALVSDRVHMIIEHDTGSVQVGSHMGKITAVKFGGNLSAENNLRSASVGYERNDKTFSVEEILPLNTGVTKDFLKNHKDLYNRDAISKIIKDMTDVLSQVKDHDILDYLDASFGRLQEAENNGFNSVFDCSPTANFTGDPIQYRLNMLRDKIDRIAIAMGEVLLTEDVYITAVGNPADVRLLNDVTWNYQKSGNVGGIKINHSFGLMNSNGYNFALTSSHRVDSGKMRFYVVPTDKRHMTYTHFEYSNTISNEYRNPNNALIPNIMVGSRYTTDELQPVQAQLDINGNEL